MGRKPRTECKRCGKVVHLSTRGICLKCALSAAIRASEQIKNKKGEYYDKWVSGMIEHAMKLSESKCTNDGNCEECVSPLPCGR